MLCFLYFCCAENEGACHVGETDDLEFGLRDGRDTFILKILIILISKLYSTFSHAHCHNSTTAAFTALRGGSEINCTVFFYIFIYPTTIFHIETGFYISICRLLVCLLRLQFFKAISLGM